MNSKNNNTFEIPVKAIVNNMIELDNGEKVAGVKIVPRNIFILEESDQFSIINSLKDMYNTFDFEFWLVVTDRPVDIAMHVAQLQAQFNQSQSSLARKLISQDLQKANQFINEGVSDVEFFFLFKEKNLETIQKRIRQMITGLAQSCLSSSQANNDDLRVILDSFLNGGEKTEFGTVMS